MLKDEMDFAGHFDVLRKHILGSLLLLVAASAVSFAFMDPIMEWLEGPALRLGFELHYFKPQEKFLAYIRTSVFLGLLATLPVFLVQMSCFVYPGLAVRERRFLAPAATVALIMYLAGTLMGHLILFPFALGFFSGFHGVDALIPVWGISDYIGLDMSLVLACSLMFQTPWILIFLVWAEVLPLEALRKGRRIAFLFSFIAAAFLTPPDVYTQILVGTVLYMLFELTVFAGVIFGRWKKK